jgi:hypothetical protein
LGTIYSLKTHTKQKSYHHSPCSQHQHKSQEAQKEPLEVLFHKKGKAWLATESLADFYHKCFRSTYLQKQVSREQNVLQISTLNAPEPHICRACFLGAKCSADFYNKSMFLWSRIFRRFLQQLLKKHIFAGHVSREKYMIFPDT